jgi:arabinan endo-1,5-alpha-L-arabinosidase
VTWRLCGDVFAHLPGWAVTDVPGLRGLWAPDVSFFDGRFHVYYSASTFGSNRSSIGLVTNETLDQSSERYKWVDRGRVIGSSPGDDWNAIDPNIVLDEANQPWMSFGSFWGGIKLRKIDAATGMLDPKDQTLYALASRPRTAELPGAVEAPFIYRKNGYYYLFVSFDFCCRGTESTYKIAVGRSRNVTGPYVDRLGTPLLQGGGTVILSAKGSMIGPGGQSVYGNWLAHHYYDARADGDFRLGLRRIDWTANGWPRL